MNGLTEGRIVRYVLEDGSETPALIVNSAPGPEPVEGDAEEQLPAEGTVHLLVFFNRESQPVEHRRYVPFSEGEPQPLAGTWHWPVQV